MSMTSLRDKKVKGSAAFKWVIIDYCTALMSHEAKLLSDIIIHIQVQHKLEGLVSISRLFVQYYNNFNTYLNQVMNFSTRSRNFFSAFLSYRADFLSSQIFLSFQSSKNCSLSTSSSTSFFKNVSPYFESSSLYFLMKYKTRAYKKCSLPSLPLFLTNFKKSVSLVFQFLTIFLLGG